MATLAQRVGVPPPPLPWFLGVSVKEELAPVPGSSRHSHAWMVIAATLVMIICCMTFRIFPMHSKARFMPLIISRENFRVTLESAATILTSLRESAQPMS